MVRIYNDIYNMVMGYIAMWWENNSSNWHMARHLRYRHKKHMDHYNYHYKGWI